MGNVNYASGGINHTNAGVVVGHDGYNAEPGEFRQDDDIVAASNLASSLASSIIKRNPRARRISCPEIDFSRTSTASHSPVRHNSSGVYCSASDSELFEGESLKLDVFCNYVTKSCCSLSSSQILRALFPENGEAYGEARGKAFDVLIKHAGSYLQNDWIDRVLADADAGMRQRAFRSLVEHAREVNKQLGGKVPEYSYLMPVTAADLWKSTRPSLVEHAREMEKQLEKPVSGSSSWVFCYDSDIEDASSIERASSCEWDMQEALSPEFIPNRLTDERIERALSDADANVRSQAFTDLVELAAHRLTDAQLDSALSDTDEVVRVQAFNAVVKKSPQHLTDERIERALSDAYEEARIRAFGIVAGHSPQHLTDARIDHALSDVEARARSNAFFHLVRFVPDRLTDVQIDRALSDIHEFARKVNFICLIRFAPTLLTAKRVDDLERSTGTLDPVEFSQLVKYLRITMTAGHLNKLPSEKFAQLDGRLFSALSDEVLAGLDAMVLNGLTDANKAKLDMRVLTEISDETYKALDENIIKNIIKNIDDALLNTDKAVRKEAFSFLVKRASHRLTASQLDRALFDPEGGVRQQAYIDMAAHAPELLETWIERAVIDTDVERRRCVVRRLVRWAPKHLTDERIDRALTDADVGVRKHTFINLAYYSPQHLTDVQVDRALTDADENMRKTAFFRLAAHAPKRLTDARVDRALSDSVALLRTFVSGCLISYAPTVLTEKRIDDLERSTGPLDQASCRQYAKDVREAVQADYLNQLPSEQFAQLDGRLFSALSDEVLAVLDAKVLNGLTDANKAKLSIRVLAKVSDETFKALDENIIKNIDDALLHTDVAVRKETFGVLAKCASHRLTDAQLDRALFDPEGGVRQQAYIDMAAHAPELLETWIERAVLDTDIERRKYIVRRLVLWAPKLVTDVRIDRALTDATAEVRRQAFIDLACYSPQHLTDARVDRALSDSVTFSRKYVSGCLIRYAPALLTAKRVDDLERSTGPLDQAAFLQRVKGVGITMSADHLNKLPSEQFSQLDGRLFAALSDEVLAGLAPKVLNGLTDANKAKLSIRVLAKVSDETFKALDKSILEHKSKAAAWALNPGYIMRYIYRPENFHGMPEERKQIIAKS